jgi:hypothetical protein
MAAGIEVRADSRRKSATRRQRNVRNTRQTLIPPCNFCPDQPEHLDYAEFNNEKGAIPQCFEESPRALGIIIHTAQYPSSRSDE